jgi:tRNA(His) 5'-end guanylyltransferase
MLPRRTYTIIRLDGKAFHTWTRDRDKPYDQALSDTFTDTTIELCKEVQGCCFGYTQSDEVSVLLTDFDSPQTNAWFDGNVQKLASVSASIFTARFNDIWEYNGHRDRGPALFDARAFTIPDPVEVENYFIWRQKDCVRNSISGLAQTHFPHRELQGLNLGQQQEKLFQERGINWADQDPSFKNGVLVLKEVFVEVGGQPRHSWTSIPCPIWTQNRESFATLIPTYGEEVENEQKLTQTA